MRQLSALRYSSICPFKVHALICGCLLSVEFTEFASIPFFSTGVVIGGGGLNFPLSRARISFGVFHPAASMVEMSSSVPGCHLPLLL
ncbi:hypothetical protein Tco_0199571 [Tanacetum coccineum]